MGKMTGVGLSQILTVAVFILMSPYTAFAQNEPTPPTTPDNEETMLFQEIPSVSGASKYEQKVTEAPSSVSIITSLEIKTYGYRTLADIIQERKKLL